MGIFSLCWSRSVTKKKREEDPESQCEAEGERYVKEGVLWYR
jgi:hypothetical protein